MSEAKTTQSVQSGEARSSAIMAAGTLVSRFLGFAKTWMLGAALGLGSTINDTFINANNLPNLIFLLVAGGVFNAVLVPQIIKASKAPDRGADYISRLLTLAVLVLLALTALVTLAAPLVIDLTTQGYSEQQKALAVTFAFWCLPQIFFYGLYALLTQVLNAHGAFGPAMWAPILNNLVAIAGLGMFIWILGENVYNPHTLDNWGPTQTLLIAGFSTFGVVAQTAILLIPVFRLRLGLRPRFGWRGVGLGQAAKLSVWTLATAAVGQLAFLYVMRIATIPGAERLRLDNAGDKAAAAVLPGNAVLEVASQLYLLPHSIIALSLATVLFNRMTRASQDGNKAELRDALSHGLRTMAVATVFGALALFALAGPLGMFFSGGEPQDGVMLAQTLTILALSTPFLSANFMMSRVFYANEDARTPLYVQLWLAVIYVVGAFFIQFLPVGQIIYAIAILYTLGNILSVVISVVFLRRLLGHLDGPRIANSYIRMGYAGLGSALAGAGALWLLGSYRADGFAWSSRPAALVTVVVVGPVMLLAYLVLLRVFHVTELRDLLRPLMGRLGRGIPAPAGAPAEPTTPARATVSDDTGLIPRISGEFDAASFRAGPALAPQRSNHPSEPSAEHLPEAPKTYLPEEDAPSTARGGKFKPQVPLPGRRTYQGDAGQNPYFPTRGNHKK
ncbi:murein biosynthesis integral membrane protein MurJ [Paenarthrobacter aurescens]|uniref:Membrane protein n=1 Tax=Paenarthrobacter aurescens TaxID=43663 RepID=A0A4Y3N9V6_PAEAU|nr:murein biosynthesis integral membrane protein MurJ [Paenarthrobacter aurescens]UKA49961.1 murein biosynthesis integral membrane protein MurJ [Arthrobacter sp. FW305-123]MDO6141686.1 murein biosynthesis integral membrane protein MurJ [Paenarthrobacter aurescens]MDO6149449.1 murein biosynthesis integral membrane protein MurJ [Paenarthrobacter aurescens]MDO6156735.1 murein biosynthesis integral membrane protein MurJ [Paenarthrobacter aurescens]MDO6160721.1 murein biosynthesis integral membrane